MAQYLNPIPQHFSADGPLAFYKVYFGEPNKDPKLFPKEPFSDQDLLVPINATQTLDTDGKYQSEIYLDGAYSIRIESPLGALWRELDEVFSVQFGQLSLIKSVGSVADMVADLSLIENQSVGTVSYLSGWAATIRGPIGGASYVIVTKATHDTVRGYSTVNETGDHTLDNGLIGLYIPQGGIVYIEQFGCIGDTTFSLTGGGYITSVIGTDNTSTHQSAIDFCHAFPNNPLKLRAGEGNFGYGSAVILPASHSFEGVGRGTALLRLTTNSDWILDSDTTEKDGVFLSGFTMQGDSAVGGGGYLRMSKFNVLAELHNIAWNNLGSGSIGLLAQSCSVIDLDTVYGNGGALSAGTYNGTNIQIENCNGITYQNLTVEHAQYGVRLLNDDAVGVDGHVAGPAFNGVGLHIEGINEAAIDISMSNDSINSHWIVGLYGIDARQNAGLTGSQNIINVNATTSTTHRVTLHVTALGFAGSWSEVLVTPTDTIGTTEYIDTIQYEAGDVSSYIDWRKSLSTITYNTLNTILVSDATKAAFQTFLGATQTGELYTDLSTGSIVLEGTNSGIVIDPESGQYLSILNLPTSNPGGTGRIWSNSGVLTIT